MSPKKPKTPPRKESELAEKVFRRQRNISWACMNFFCIIPCIIIAWFILSHLKAYMGHGPDSVMTILLKLLILAPIIILFAMLGYAANMLAAVMQVFSTKWLFPSLSMPEAQEIILQYYTDPRMLYPYNTMSFRSPLSFFFVPPGIRETWLLKRCQRLARWAIGVAYLNRDFQP